MKTSLVNNWWLLSLNGVIAILYGLMAIFVPSGTLLTIVMYFGIVILIIGVSMLIGAINSARNQLPYMSDLISSVLTIAIGALLTFYTQKSLEIFVIVVGSWAILLGIFQLYIMSRMDKTSGSKNTLLINGLITLAFGVVLFLNPFASAAFMVVVSGVLAFIVGIILIALSVKLRNFEKSIVEDVDYEEEIEED